jgi:RNA polymerase sigma-70 factor (ECF subfamily)
VRRCLNGDALAQKQFYERFAGRMLGVCYRYAGNMHEAEDLLQEGFIRAFHRLKDFRGEGSLEGWLRRIMVTTSLNFLKHEKRIREQLELKTAGEESSSSVEILEQMESQEVMKLIQQLSPGYRAVLNLFAIEGFSHREIGEMLGIGESTSRSQFTRARQLLQKMIEEHFSYGLNHERAESRKGI